MSNNYVSMHYHKETSARIITSAYEFEPQGRFQWLQRFMWRMLFKMESLKSHYELKDNIKTIVIDRGSVAKNLLTAYMSCFPYRTRPTRVYMGHKQFEELSFNQLEHHLVGFDFSVPMNYERTVFDLPIIVVPTMDGVLII